MTTTKDEALAAAEKALEKIGSTYAPSIKDCCVTLAGLRVFANDELALIKSAQAQPVEVSQSAEELADYWSDWLVDAVAGATQNRMFLRGEAAEDEIATGAILANGKKAISNALKAYGDGRGQAGYERGRRNHETGKK